MLLTGESFKYGKFEAKAAA